MSRHLFSLIKYLPTQESRIWIIDPWFIKDATKSLLVFPLSLIPLPTTRLASVTSLTNSMWQEWCPGISEARSQEALWHLPGSLGRMPLGALNHPMSLTTSVPCCSGEEQAEASLPAIPVKTLDLWELPSCTLHTSSSTIWIAVCDLCQPEMKLKTGPC